MTKNRLIKNFSYPDVYDSDFQTKLLKKREFIYHQIQPRKKMKSYEEIKNYRESICNSQFSLREHQAILKNFINPDNSYKGLLVMHGTGTGKSCTAIAIAEQFKEQILKYNTQIYILISGPNIRENMKKELLYCTGNTYLKNQETLEQMSKEDKEKEKKLALHNVFQYYKILSYKSFYKKVLGEKIVEKKFNEDNTKIKSSYKKTEDGLLEREIVLDKITQMNNTIIIVDEAHNLTGNEYGDALKHIIKNSENLKVILLTATPMKNLADDIIDLLNFIRPVDKPILRDHVFTGEKNYTMKFKPGGLEYLKKMASGYVSYFRGNIPYTFAKRIDKGIIPKNMLFTPVIKCFMEFFQYNTYLDAIKTYNDALDRASSAAANFVFPGLTKDKTNLIGYHSTEGLNTVLNQLETDGPKLRSLINKKIFNNMLKKEVEENFIFQSKEKNITGLILKKEYLKFFSIKFYKAIKRLDKLFEKSNSNKKSGIAFVYSNLVRAGGMEIFAEALIQNGYLEYDENSKNYDIKDNTIDYKTGRTYLEYKKLNKTNEFKPATFILITGGVDESGEDVPEIKQRYIQEKFNSIDNIEGSIIKLCLGSKVMNEGITLENVQEIHILDVHYNLGKTDQVIGRGIRMCKHQNSINDKNKFPKVNIYRYVVSIKPENEPILTKIIKKNSELSTDELLYQKAELKYLLIKDVEHALKEVAIDCPLLLHGNMFPEEIEKYKGCSYPTLENIKEGKQICPVLCDFRECTLKCKSKEITVKPEDIDYNTFNDKLANFEIIAIKNKIKDLYRFKHVYLYHELLDEIKKSLTEHQIKLFDDYFLDQALEELMPTSENDFNNFKDIIYDKYNRAGYIIQRNKYYIYQPFDENEDITMFYRQNIPIKQSNLVSIENYIKQKYGNLKNKIVKEETITKKNVGYNFDDVIDYYEEREENFIVGIVDKNNNDEEIFKIREPIKKNDKKRGIGIQTIKGWVCSTKDKSYLLNIIKKLKDINLDGVKLSKDNLCLKLKEHLLYLEKYSTTRDNNKITYVMIPSNSEYPFPYNLEDRIKNRIKTINKIAEKSVDIKVIKKNLTYELVFKNIKNLNKTKLENLGCILKNDNWSLLLD